MDDQAVAQIQGDTNTTVNVGWDSVAVGLTYAAGTSPTNVLVDDVKAALYADFSPHRGRRGDMDAIADVALRAEHSRPRSDRR